MLDDFENSLFIQFLAVPQQRFCRFSSAFNSVQKTAEQALAVEQTYAYKSHCLIYRSFYFYCFYVFVHVRAEAAAGKDI